MRLWYFSDLLTVILDVAAWFVLHMVIAFSATLLPHSLFHEKMWLFRTRSWEQNGLIYKKWFGIDRWKNRMPDGASWFRRGFPKKHLNRSDPVYLDRFIKETCRGEVTHWFVITVSPLFFLFNVWYAGIIMIIYALFANLPCIIIQRFNRPKLIHLYNKKKMRQHKEMT